MDYVRVHQRMDSGRLHGRAICQTAGSRRDQGISVTMAATLICVRAAG
jgi:hypothetical protein